jgi:hypothetical protein
VWAEEYAVKCDLRQFILSAGWKSCQPDVKDRLRVRPRLTDRWGHSMTMESESSRISGVMTKLSGRIVAAPFRLVISRSFMGCFSGTITLSNTV